MSSTTEARTRFAESVAASQDVDYFRDYEHVSQSMLKVLLESPQAYYERFITQTYEPEPTEAMEFGRKFHMALLQPDEFRARYAVPPKCDRRTTEGKKRFAEWCDENKGKEAIDAEEMSTLVAMQASAFRNPDVRMLLTAEGPVEEPIRWEDRILRKAKPDKIATRLGAIPDLKSIADPTPRGFASAAARFGWWLQSPWYIDAAMEKYREEFRFLFILVGKSYPHEVGIYEMTSDDLEWADERTEKLVTELLARTNTNNWLADWQRGEPNKIPLPRWLRSDFYQVGEETYGD